MPVFKIEDKDSHCFVAENEQEAKDLFVDYYSYRMNVDKNEVEVGTITKLADDKLLMIRLEHCAGGDDSLRTCKQWEQEIKKGFLCSTLF